MTKKEKASTVLRVGSLELTEDVVRTRAYELFEQRGYQHGHDVEDWLQAEAELKGKKSTSSADESSKVPVATAA